ncbi:MAG: efflux RND transporter permease subunit, partial [Sporomusa sp.]
MDKFADGIIGHKRAVVIVFIALAIFGGIMSTTITTNYNMTDYLPQNAQSTQALEIMDEEFEQAVPNMRVLVKDVTIQQALSYRDELSELDGVSDVIWLDDVVNLKQPLEVADQSVVEGYYKDGNALISLTVADGKESVTMAEIYEIIGEDNALSGDAADTANQQNSSASEVAGIVTIVVPLGLLILIIATNSWLDPILFFATIGVAILINFAATALRGEVSFITNSVAPILQLAVSLDYAIFLMHSFEEYREELGDEKLAMRYAIRRSFPTIMASAATTFFGFLALTFMDFGIGADLGMSLLLGIVFSFLSVIIFLPALI